MQESFLHYLWQFQFFNKQSLITTQGEPIQIFHPGNRNVHAGPDFFNARIKIDSLQWVGSVELHVQSSEWVQHHHEEDPAYENVVLHVVWRDDKPVKRLDGTWLPTIELKNRVSDDLLINYKRLINSPNEIPCASSLRHVPDITRLSMLDKALTGRLETKASYFLDLWQRNQHDWNETCYQLLSRNFGFHVNAEPFQQLAQSLPYSVIRKHADKLYQVEALLFGQAGFLDRNTGDEYYLLLRREYHLLSNKYGLKSTGLNIAQWRFLRLRPANFPTVRLAQMAALLHHQHHIFSAIMDGLNMKNFFAVRQSAYWLEHYHFSKKSGDAIAGLGLHSVENILINTVAPLLAAVGKSKDDQQLVDRAIALLQQLPNEVNSITRRWKETGIVAKTAFDSQAVIELYTNFCLKRRCLECNIGASMLKPSLH
ncbi:MAG: DUF2851 family protein [Cyclobacteriaceae bacterium]|nr:DUF2851 family protein [Cyclobacteriaceae bacterium]